MTTITVKANEGPRNAHLEGGERWYEWQGRRVMSVTTWLHAVGQAHRLVSWKERLITERAVDQLDTLNAMMTREAKPRERVLEKNRRKEAKAWLRRSHIEERDWKAARGTAVHRNAEHDTPTLDIKDYTDSESGVVVKAEDIRPYSRQYRNWVDEGDFEIILKERQVFNLALGYAGSFDILGREKATGEIVICDIKTGASIYADNLLQQMAYACAEFVGADDVIDEEATALLAQVSGVAILHLSSTGWEYLRLQADSEAWAAFRGLLAFSQWTKDHGNEDAFVVAKTAGAAELLIEEDYPRSAWDTEEVTA